MSQKYDEDFRFEVLTVADEEGPTAAAIEFNVPLTTIQHWKVRRQMAQAAKIRAEAIEARKHRVIRRPGGGREIKS